MWVIPVREKAGVCVGPHQVLPTSAPYANPGLINYRLRGVRGLCRPSPAPYANPGGLAWPQLQDKGGCGCPLQVLASYASDGGLPSPPRL